MAVIFCDQEKEYELSEVFEHQSGVTLRVELDNTIILSNSDNKKYLYNVSGGSQKESSEGNITNKSDNNLMDNEIIAFVPAEDENWQTPKYSNTTQSTNEITVEPKQSTEETPTKHFLKKKDGHKKQIHKKKQVKDKFLKGSMKVEFPTSLGIRSKPSTARKKLQRARGSIRAFRNTKGYHASSGPMDFLKKRYKSEYLEVSNKNGP